MGCTECQTIGPLRAIIEGFGNWIFPNKEVEIIAKERAMICSTCPKNKFNLCTNCDGVPCPIPTKIRSINKQTKCEKWKR